MSAAKTVVPHASLCQPFAMLNAVRLRIDLAYDGTGFYGWAKQPEIRTVQGEIELRCCTILRVPEGDPTNRCALPWPDEPTPALHASHQVCHLDVNEDVLKRCVGHHGRAAVIALTRRLQRMLPGRYRNPRHRTRSGRFRRAFLRVGTYLRVPNRR